MRRKVEASRVSARSKKEGEKIERVNLPDGVKKRVTEPSQRERV